MGTTVAPVEYDAIAVLSDHGEPLLGDAEVIVGDGQTKIMFKKGRAKVTAAEAALLIHRADVDIPGYTPELQPPEVSETAPVQAGSLPAGAVVNGDGTITLPTSALSPEQREAVRQALAIEPVEFETTKPTPGDEAALQAAQEYLAAEGMEVPDSEVKEFPGDGVEKTGVEVQPVTVPEGFQATTYEGEARCLARKADGSQCSNVSKGDTTACGLKKHQEQRQT